MKKALFEKRLAVTVPLLVLLFTIGISAHQSQDAELVIVALIIVVLPSAGLTAVVGFARSRKRGLAWAWAIVAFSAIAAVVLAPLGGIAAEGLFYTSAVAVAAITLGAVFLTIVAFIGTRAGRFATTGVAVVSLAVAATGVVRTDLWRDPPRSVLPAPSRSGWPAPSQPAVPPAKPSTPSVARPSEPPADGRTHQRSHLEKPDPMTGEPPGLYALFEEGTFHGGEVRASPGPAFALVRQDQEWNLVSVNVHFETVHDVVLDSPGTSQPSGIRVSIENRRELPAQQLLLLTGPFAPGPLLSVTEQVKACVQRWTSAARDDGTRQSCNVELAGNRFEISASRVQHVEVERGFSKPMLMLVVRRGSTEQKLPWYGPVLWAGDLDRDGGLDLLLDGAFHYVEIQNLHLYLSSLAAPDAIFDLAARFHASAD